MSALDWPAMLAQLEQQRAALDQERADIDAVIATVRRRASLAVPAGLHLPPARHGRTKAKGAKASPRPAAGKRGSRTTDPAGLARMKREYETGVSVKRIAAAVGVSEQAVYSRASLKGWKRAPGQGVKAGPAAKAQPQPKGEQLAGSVKCTNPDCGVMTDHDPCIRCGKKLTRKGW